MRYITSTTRLDFGTDPDPDVDTESIFPFFHYGEIGRFQTLGLNRITQKVMNECS